LSISFRIQKRFAGAGDDGRDLAGGELGERFAPRFGQLAPVHETLIPRRGLAIREIGAALARELLERRAGCDAASAARLVLVAEEDALDVEARGQPRRVLVEVALRIGLGRGCRRERLVERLGQRGAAEVAHLGLDLVQLGAQRVVLVEPELDRALASTSSRISAASTPCSRSADEAAPSWPAARLLCSVTSAW